MNCDGKMYVDKYRLRKGKFDHPPVCTSDCFPQRHRVNTVGCKYYQQHIAERNSKPRSKHSPIAERDWVPF